MSAFALEPMSGYLRGLTYVVLPLPLALVWGASLPGPQRPALAAAAAFSALVYASVWFWWRPSRFEVSQDELVLVFPLRRRRVPRASISRARVFDRAEFKERYGWAVRCGAGGLWGGFGFLWTSKRGRLDFYITRTDRWVLVERSGAPDLLISVAEPERFVAALSAKS